MALRALLLGKKLTEKREALTAMETRSAEFETREAELAKAIEEITEENTAEERSAVEEEVTAFETEKAELEEKKNSLVREISEIEAELAKLEESAPAQEAREEEEFKPVERNEEKMEVRDTKEYIEAFARYIKTGKDMECRALLKTENVTNGTVPVPTFVYDTVKTAWEKDGIMNLVRKSYLRGNLKVSFEISGSDAAVHTEGGAAVSDEDLILGIVTMKAANIKKMVKVSDESLEEGPEEFLRYIYDEIAYKIAKKAASELLGKIEACGTVSTTTCPGVPVVAAAPGLATIATAMAELSGDASNPVIVMNRSTWGAFKAAQAAGSYAYDPFEGLPIVFNNDLPAYSATSSGDTYAIVGDFGEGALANFPSGEEIKFVFDGYTDAAADVVRVIGRQFVALDVVAQNAFVKIQNAGE